MRIHLLCLGVGHGGSFVLKGVPSSSYILCVNEKPFILIDCGDGIAFEYLKRYKNVFPKYIYISHNHSDHSGDLPLFIVNAYKSHQHKFIILGEKEVLKIIRKYRMHEMIHSNIDIDEVADWVSDKEFKILLDESISMELVRTKHSYICFGFNLFYEGIPILGFSADSAYEKELYDFLSISSTILLDGNINETDEHASYEQIINFSKRVASSKVLVTHHGMENDIPDIDNVNFLEKGEKIILYKEKEDNMHTTLHSRQ